MRRTAAHRHGTRTAKRRGLGVLVLLWVNLVVTPCAVALGGEHTCMHAPPAELHSTTGHEHEHMHQHEAPPCDVAVRECCEVADAIADPRVQDLKPKNAVDAELAGAPPYVELQPPLAAGVTAVADPPDPPFDSAPRHVLFCVFLD